MKPEELFDPAKLPEDLQWVAARYKLQPDDPVFLLIAWHWNRIKAGEDTLRAAIVELKAALDGRIVALSEAAETVAGVGAALVSVQDALEQKPEELGQQFEAQLRQPMANALAQIKALGKSLAPLARTFQAAQHRQLLAALLAGVALGILAAVVALLA
jgi:DNA-binding transcriptional regulator YbjK